MKKMFKRITASLMAVTTLAVSMVGISANAEEYADSANWSVHWSDYSSNSPQTLRLVYHGDGYYATMTGKAGSSSLNLARISAPGVTPPIEVSEIGISRYLHPTYNGTDYIDFKIVLIWDGEHIASNSGTITIA